MNKTTTCIRCGKQHFLSGQLCRECEETISNQGELIEYSPDQRIIASESFGQRIFSFFQAYFSRPEVQTAFEAHAQSLCDEPSQSSLSSRGKGAVKCTP